MAHLVTAERVLDMRPLASEARAAQVLSRFDSLSPGEHFVLVSGDTGHDLLCRLRAERRGLFEWSPLEAGPSVFRVEIARRGPPPEGREE